MNSVATCFLSVGLLLLAAPPSSAMAWWTGAQKVMTVYSGYTDQHVAVKMNGTQCSAGIAVFTTATSNPEKVAALAGAALVSGATLECSITSCDASGNGVGTQCKLNRN